MKNQMASPAESRKCCHLIFFFFLITITYSNSFHAAWHLDDVTNILDNQNVHVSTLSLDDWSKSIRPPFTDPSNPELGLSGLYRPVAMLTFAFNWYLRGRDVFGYHLVNIGLHCVTAALLFFTILKLLRAPNMNDRYQGSEHFIALLAAALWALHPIQTQAVTYIVQRMAALAALFYLSGIFLFVEGRNAQIPGKRFVFYGLCLVSFLLAMGSKQNAATLPAAILLIETIFFFDPKLLKRDKTKWIAAGTIAGLAIIGILLLFLWQKNPISAIADGYKLRSFTLMERLLTELRVMIFYLWQIFYPVPEQFSIVHEFDLSQSLLTPWTTLGALILICALIVAAFYSMRNYPLLSFSIFFFFLGHSVESTIFPLELVFEHRNYLPSLFLFVPVASGIKRLMDIYRKKNKMLYVLLLCFVPILITGLALGSYTRNMAWATEKTLWQDAMQKTPSLARPYQGLALVLEKENRLDDALKLYQKALDLKDPEPKLSRFISLSNMGNIYKKRNMYERAVQYLTAAINVETGAYASKVRHNLVLCLLNIQKEAEALVSLELLLTRQKNNGRLLAIKGFILLQQGKTDLALHHLRRALKLNPYDKDVLLCLAMALSAKNEYKRADWYLRLAKKSHPQNLAIVLGLLQNAIKMQDVDRINAYLLQLIDLFRMDEITYFFTEHAKGYHYINGTMVPIEDSIILPYLAAFVKKKAQNLGNGSIE
jgi:tetratricopeptide (TPR) repeat protein